MKTKVTLHMALQEKNRLAGELRKLAALVTTHNRFETDASGEPLMHTGLDLGKLHEELAQKVERLVDLKTSITRANVHLYPKLARLAELKGLVALYQALDTKQGRERHFEPKDPTPKDRYFKAHIGLSEQLTRVTKLENELFFLQVEVDRYNNETLVEMEVGCNE